VAILEADSVAGGAFLFEHAVIKAGVDEIKKPAELGEFFSQ